MRYLLILVIAGFASTIAARVTTGAGQMSCAEFRNRISKAIADGGDRVAQPNLNEIAFQRPDKSMTRYALTEIEGLTGDLRCTGDDNIEFFDAMTEIPDFELGGLHILRISYLAAAAICAVTPTGTPQFCKGQAKHLLDSATKNYSRAHVRGEPAPSGFEKLVLKGGFEAEFDVQEGNVSFSLVPPLASKSDR